MASRSINIYSPLTRPVSRDIFVAFHQVLLKGDGRRGAGKMVISHRNVVYSAIQESSTATVTDKKEAAPDKKEAPEKPKRTAPAKAPVKALPLLMEEDVIPSLKATLEAHADISQIELSFNDNTLEGSFVKKTVRYYFWAFFPDGVLTGPKGFALSSSYETEVSTIEPFLIDEKKITATQVVFWVEKRLAAQGILPVWDD